MASSSDSSPRVILIAWPGVVWHELQEVLRADRLPSLSRLLEQSASGRLRESAPNVAESAWASLLTGRHAYEHGVLNSHEPLPTGIGTVAITRPAIRCATLPTILSATGRVVHQIGWPISHPAERLRGIVVTDRFSLEAPNKYSGESQGWPWVTPANAAADIFSRRYLPQEVDEVTLTGLIPREIPPGYLPEMERFGRQILAESLTHFRCVKLACESSAWSALLCCFPTFARLQTALATPTAKGLEPALHREIFARVAEHLDMLLGQLLAGHTETDIVALVAVGPSKNLRPSLAIRAPGIQVQPLPPQAHLLDVVPTLLALLGLPQSRNMPGRVWTELFENDSELQQEIIATWDTHIHHPPPTEEKIEQALTQRGPEQYLVELGYSDPVEDALRERAVRCSHDTARNRIASLLDAGQTQAAIEELQALANKQPEWLFVHEFLATAYLRLGQTSAADGHLEWLANRGVVTSRYFFLSGQLCAARREFRAACQHYHVASRMHPPAKGLHSAWGKALQRLRDFEAAREQFQLAMREGDDCAELRDGLAVCDLAAKKFAAAAESALDAVALEPLYAAAHYHLALALLGLDKQEEAKRALLTCTRIDSEFLAALRQLRNLELIQGNTAEADRYDALCRKVMQQKRQPAADASATSA